MAASEPEAQAIVESVDLPGYPTQRVTLRNDQCEAIFSDVGARLLELHVPDREGTFVDVVLGRADLADTFSDRHYMGSTAGRYAGRIRGGRFALDGREHQLTVNEGAHHLHGGVRGFDQHIWSTTVDPEGKSVTFARISPDGEEGFPGEVVARVTYRLVGSVLSIDMVATTDRPTIVRLVNHAYWNLAGHDAGSVLDHELQLNSSRYVPIDDELLPTGEILSVRGTPFDFLDPHRVGERNFEVANSGAGRVSDGSAGYDNIWVLDGAGLRAVGSVTDPGSGRRLELATDQPALCLYVGGYMEGLSAKGEHAAYASFSGLTLETTGFPDDINQPHFPSPILLPTDTYRNRMRLTFSAG